MSKPYIYFGCALSHAPKEFKAQSLQLRNILETYGTVFKFLGLEHPSIGEVLQWDLACVRRCDLFVADTTYPSLGLGAEFGVALEHNKPMITLADDAVALPRQFIDGHKDPLHLSLRYTTVDDAKAFLKQAVPQLLNA